jgi:DNA-directed RNA polymerase specialized sigma24 family protein
MADVAALLPASREGNAEAFAEAYSLAYDELRRLARRQLGGAPRGRTLVTTVLVNGAFVKLVRRHVDVQDRAHFFALAARTVRREWQKAKAFLYRELTRHG